MALRGGAAGGWGAASAKRGALRQRLRNSRKNPPKRGIKAPGVTWVRLDEKMAAIGVQENERNLNNKISRGGDPVLRFNFNVQ